MISSLFSFLFFFEQIKDLKLIFFFGEGLYEEVENYINKNKGKSFRERKEEEMRA